jgi:DNA-binding response OmpR family regulator
MAQQPFILIVEDDEQLRTIIARNLQARGYMVFEAASFREAVNRISIKPHLMILDINLPDASGWDVADWLESVAVDVPIVVISGAITPTAKQWERFHPRAFLAKPFDIGDLMRLVEEHAPAVARAGE